MQTDCAALLANGIDFLPLLGYRYNLCLCPALALGMGLVGFTPARAMFRPEIPASPGGRRPNAANPPWPLCRGLPQIPKNFAADFVRGKRHKVTLRWSSEVYMYAGPSPGHSSSSDDMTPITPKVRPSSARAKLHHDCSASVSSDNHTLSDFKALIQRGIG
ncbi:hypothetical protein BDZ88DRAFT_169117 [Geranomyces variabilis]|nr:hypothetical protein BDZ88DRAFT_169117 [Geranomyces variabilis]